MRRSGKYRRSPGSLRAIADRIPPRRRRAHGPLQPPLRAPRSEDTDVERSREELSGQSPSALDWLGLQHDEGPYYQSKRSDLYRAAADRLIAEGKAFRAFETPEELDAARKKAESEGRSYRYSGAGRDLAPDESDRRARAGEK